MYICSISIPVAIATNFLYTLIIKKQHEGQHTARQRICDMCLPSSITSHISFAYLGLWRELCESLWSEINLVSQGLKGKRALAGKLYNMHMLVACFINYVDNIEHYVSLVAMSVISVSHIYYCYIFYSFTYMQ